MKKKRQITSVVFQRFFVYLFLLVFLVPLSVSTISPKIASAASNSDPTLDMQRRKLHTFASCIQAEIDANNGDINSWPDLYAFFPFPLPDPEIVVVGIDRESYNGVMKCSTVVEQGIHVLDPSVGNTDSWFLKALTGQSDFSSGKALHINDNMGRQLLKRVQDAEFTIGGPTDDLRRKRIIEMAPRCYNISAIANSTSFDFKAAGGFFTLKSADDIRSYIDNGLHINKNNGTSLLRNNVLLGDLQLGFNWFNSGLGTFSPGQSNFYPVGDDFSQAAASKNGILDCDFVKNNASWLFQGYSVNSKSELVGPDGVVVGSSTTNGGGGTGEQKDTCESNGGDLAWLLCPVIRILDKAISTLDTFIQAQLETPDPDKVHCNPGTNCNPGTTGNPLKEAWGRLRNIALIILVPIMLVMVIGTALGFGFLDAYTVKKAIPRFLLAVLFISVSWYITSFLITITNVIGQGIFGLMAQPFGVQDKSLAAFISPAAAGGVSLAGFVILGGLVFAGAVSFGIILSIAFVAVIALFLGFIILTLRQILIIALVMLAPLAILSWIFPSNDRLWKLWWGTFTKLLLMYPLILMLIASGRIFASIIDLSRGDSFINQIMMIIAFIIPYFFIPATFKFAGGIFATMSGAIVNRGRAISDSQKKRRQEARGRLQARARAGGFQDRGIGRVRNRLGQGAQVGWRGRFGVGRQGRAALATATLAGNEDTLRENSALRELRNFDDANAVMGLSGATSGGAREAARDLFTDEHGVYDEARAERALAATDAVGYSRRNAAAALQTMSQNKSRAIRAGDIATVQRGINRLAGGNAQAAENMEYNYQYFSREAGRGDLGGAWHQPGIQARATALSASAGITQEEAMRHTTALDGIGRTEVPSMVRGYPAQLQQYADTIRTMMVHGSAGERDTAAQHLLEMQKALPYASDDNKRIINELLTGTDIDGAVVGTAFVDYASTASIEDQIAAHTGTSTTGTALSRAARVYDREMGTAPGGPGSVGGTT